MFIDDYNVMEEEFWYVVNYLYELGGCQEVVLLVVGLGLEYFFDLCQDVIDVVVYWEIGILCIIEGLLYVVNVLLVEGYVCMDDGVDVGEVMWLYGEVKDIEGWLVVNVIVDIWYVNIFGNYFFFDSGQSEYNLCWWICIGVDGCYSVCSIMFFGYGCLLDGLIQKLLDRLGCYGNCLVYIYFFVFVLGYKYLISQINFNGDKYLWDDFVFVICDGLIVDLVKVIDCEIIVQCNFEGEYIEVCFDFILCKVLSVDEEQCGICLCVKE